MSTRVQAVRSGVRADDNDWERRGRAELLKGRDRSSGHSRTPAPPPQTLEENAGRAAGRFQAEECLTRPSLLCDLIKKKKVMNYLPNTGEKKTKQRGQPQPSEEKQPFPKKLYKKDFSLWLTSLHDKSEDNIKSSLYRDVPLTASGPLAGMPSISISQTVVSSGFVIQLLNPMRHRLQRVMIKTEDVKLERPGGLPWSHCPWRPSQAGCSQAMPPKATFPQIICPVTGRSSCHGESSPKLPEVHWVTKSLCPQEIMPSRLK